MNNTTEVKKPNTVSPVATPSSAPAFKPRTGFKPNFSRGGEGQLGGNKRGPRRGSRDNKERVKPEFDSKIVLMRRVTRVTSGGRRMAFSVAVVAGDRKGRVGFGLGKSIDTSMAIDKATREAKKNMIKVAHTAQMSIPHEISAKYCSAIVTLIPAKGRGLVAGSATRNVLELAGLKDINAKILSGSKNKINIARATIKALNNLPTANFAKTVRVVPNKEVNNVSKTPESKEVKN